MVFFYAKSSWQKRPTVRESIQNDLMGFLVGLKNLTLQPAVPSPIISLPRQCACPMMSLREPIASGLAWSYLTGGIGANNHEFFQAISSA